MKILILILDKNVCKMYDTAEAVFRLQLADNFLNMLLCKIGTSLRATTQNDMTVRISGGRDNTCFCFSTIDTFVLDGQKNVWYN